MLRRTAAKAFGAETGSEAATRMRAAPRKEQPRKDAHRKHSKKQPPPRKVGTKR